MVTLFSRPPMIIFLIKISYGLINIVGRLHDTMDVQVQAFHLEYRCLLDEQMLVFFYLVGDFLRTI